MEVCGLHIRVQESLDRHNEFVGRTELKLDGLCRSVNIMDRQIEELMGIARSNRDGIADLNKILRNGSGKVLSDHPIEEEENAVPGFAGSLNRAWNTIKEKFALYLILGATALAAWFLLQKAAFMMGWREFF